MNSWRHFHDRGIGARVAAGAIAVAFGSNCGWTSTPSHQSGSASASDANSEWLAERAADVGLNFVHVNGMTGKFYYPEIMAPGVALLDYDGDGDLDVYAAQGRTLGPASARPGAGSSDTLGGRLFRNDLQVDADGRRSLHFVDVTASSGIHALGYGMGVAAADVDNDGCVDLYLTNLGTNQLYHNNCDGTFTDVSKKSGTDDSGWSVSAAFLDYDRDGWLDLFVGHYVRYSIETDVRCFLLAGGPNYCPPQVYGAEPSRLYHNNRDGTFTDVTATAGLATQFGPALGVSTADFNGDGWIDLFVANDGQANQLWINQHDGTFRNTALSAGTAFGEDGKAKSSMGVDAGDFDNDGDDDLFVTELAGQGIDLYVNDGTAVFEEASARAGLRGPTLRSTGFGTAWLDLDNDGWLDLLTVNGAVTRDPDRPDDAFSLQQGRQLFRNLRNGRFEDVTTVAGAAFARADVGRGAAFGDIDNDGDTDIVVANDSGPLRLFINNVGNRHRWVGFKLTGNAFRRDMLGARVGVTTRAGITVWRRARSDGSYASSSDPRVLVGLGDAADPVAVKVRWPSGRTESFSNVSADRYTTLVEGTGR